MQNYVFQIFNAKFTFVLLIQRDEKGRRILPPAPATVGVQKPRGSPVSSSGGDSGNHSQQESNNNNNNTSKKREPTPDYDDSSVATGRRNGGSSGIMEDHDVEEEEELLDDEGMDSGSGHQRQKGRIVKINTICMKF